MTKREFLKEHKEEIDSGIKKTWGYKTVNDSDREAYIENDESWYRYARAMGVRV